MAGKRKVKGAEREDLSKPSRWRLQHGGFGPPRREAASEQAPVARRRAADVLGRLETNGTIPAEMREAGRLFHAQFRAAALDRCARRRWSGSMAAPC